MDNRERAFVKRGLIAIAVSTLALLAVSKGAHAQMPMPGMQCLSHDTMVTRLDELYGEAPVAEALLWEGRRIAEVFVSSDGDTWTLVGTAPNGTSCVLSYGTNWSAVGPAPEGVGF